MGFELSDMEVIIDAIASLWGVLFAILDPLIIKFLELVIAYMTGEIVDNVYFFSFFFVILATTLILYLKFVR